MYTIHLSGGVGNQLFQISFARYLALNSFDVRVVHYTRPQAVPHTNISSFPLIEFDKVLRLKSKKISKIGGFSDPWDWKYCLPLGLDDFRKAPNFVPKYFELRNKNIIGYFQNHEILSLIDEAFLSGLSQTLQNWQGQFQLDQQVTVLHVRRGDTLNPENRNSVGILDRYYYEEAINRIGNNRLGQVVVLTDDLQEAKDLLLGLKVDKFVNPRDSNVFSALAIMSRASNLVASNSTLAWWGGVLANQSGGSVYIPSPFFLNTTKFSSKAFRASNFSIVPAKFKD